MVRGLRLAAVRWRAKVRDKVCRSSRATGSRAGDGESERGIGVSVRIAGMRIRWWVEAPMVWFGVPKRSFLTCSTFR